MGLIRIFGEGLSAFLMVWSLELFYFKPELLSYLSLFDFRASNLNPCVISQPEKAWKRKELVAKM